MPIRARRAPSDQRTSISAERLYMRSSSAILSKVPRSTYWGCSQRSSSFSTSTTTSPNPGWWCCFTGTPRPSRVTYLTPGKDTCFYVRRTDRWLLLWFNPEADYTGIAARLSPEQPAGEELFKSWTLGNFLLEVERPNAYSVRFLPNRGQERSIPSAFNTWGMPDDVGVNVLFRPRK